MTAPTDHHLPTAPSGRRPIVLHLTTVDMSLALLLGPQLKAFVDAGYDVIGAAAPGPYQERIEATGTRFIPLRHTTRAMRPHRDLLALIELVRLFRRIRPDIVHTHNPKPGWYGRLAARLAGVSHVVNTVHGLYALPDDPPLKRHIVYTLERLAARCSDAELVQNPEDTETLRSLGVPDRKLHELGNGIDLDRFDRSRVDADTIARVRADLLGVEAEPPKTVGAPPPSDGSDAHPADAESGPPASTADTVLVGVVGRLVWEKGLREILDAGAALRTRTPNVQIVIVGPTDPDKADGLTDTVLHRLSQQSGVRFAGERTDMAAVYAAFDLFVLATHREGFPRAAMEATAMGVPVIATDIRGCRQVVDDGTTGVLVPVRNAPALADAIQDLAGHPTRRADMARAGVERAQRHFDQQHQIDLTLDLYRQLLGEAVPAGPPAEHR